MATDYGTDILAASDLPDPEVLGGGDINVAYALARRLLQPAEANAEIGITQPYECLDVRDWLGSRPSSADLASWEAQVNQVLSSAPRVSSVTATLAFTAGTITISVSGKGASGPFSFVLSVTALTATILRGS